MKATVLVLSLFLGISVLSGCATGGTSGGASGGASGDGNSRSGVQIYGTVDTGIGYQSQRISRD